MFLDNRGELSTHCYQHSFWKLLDAVILRIPVLYGEVQELSESAVTVLFDKLLSGPAETPTMVSHYERRYPTHVRDIAHAIVVLAKKKEEVSFAFQFHGMLLIWSRMFPRQWDKSSGWRLTCTLWGHGRVLIVLCCRALVGFCTYGQAS